MLKSRKKLITKLLMLTICTSLTLTTMAYASEEKTNIVKTSGKIIEVSENKIVNSSVTNNSDFKFDITTGTIIQYIGSKTDVVIPDNINGIQVKKIGSNAFSDCSNLTSITIPNGVNSIGTRAFENCNSMTKITIPNSVTEIGNYAFYNCKSLTGLTIPDGVKKIEDFTFYNCNSLTKITIPNSVTSIGAHAFEHCKNITSITIPNSVKSIGGYAFVLCEKLANINIPNSVTSIGDDAFGSCYSLKSIVIPNSITSIGDWTFIYCDNLTSITVPDSIINIGNQAFLGCNKALFYVKSEKIKRLLINSDVDENKIILNSQSSNINVTAISLNTTCLNWKIGMSGKFTTTISPSNASNKTLIWTTSNEKVATIDQNGNIKAVGAGTAVITVRTKDGSNKSATCTVKVTSPIKVTSIKLNATNLMITKGKTLILTVNVFPTEATNKSVIWRTENDDIATVDSNGKITAVGVGTTNIVCMTKDGNLRTSTCKVTVTK